MKKTIKKIWNKVTTGFTYLVATLLLVGMGLIPVTAFAWCIQFWINLFS